MALLTYLLFAFIGTVVLGPLGLLGGLLLAWLVNRNAQQIEAEWGSEDKDTLKDIARRNRR